MTCERGLIDYMICTSCHTVITGKPIEVGRMFNCSPDTSTVCSEKCEKELTERVSNGTWMEYRGFPKTSE